MRPNRGGHHVHSKCWHFVSAQQSPAILIICLRVRGPPWQESLPLGVWGPGEGRLPTPCRPQAERWLPRDSLGTPGTRRSLQAGQSWRDSGRGPRWHWSRNAAGRSWHSPAAGCTWSGRAQVRPPVGSSPRPAAATRAQPLPQGASPCLQGTPATIGVRGTHAVPAGGVHSTGSDFHPGHLEAEARAQLHGEAAMARALRCWGN